MEVGGDRIGVVGKITARGPLASLDDAVLVRSDGPAVPVRYLQVLAEPGDTVRAARQFIAIILSSGIALVGITTLAAVSPPDLSRRR